MTNEEFSGIMKAAEEGHSEAQFKLGNAYRNGDGVPKDPQKAVYWFTKAAEQGHQESNAIIKSIKESIDEMAEEGDLETQYNAAESYRKGGIAPRDAEKAAYWYTKAAEQGHLMAQVSLGIAYTDGEGITQNAEKAAYWFTKAAEQGLPEAQRMLGTIYSSGTGVTKDPQKAAYWFTKAAEQGLPEAQIILGLVHIKGKRYNRGMKIKEETYQQIEALLPKQRGNVTIPNRRLLEALLYRLENGCKRRKLPKEYGPWHTVYVRLSRWAAEGVMEQICRVLQQQTLTAAPIDAVSLDSTIIKVHPDGCGALKKRSAGGRQEPRGADNEDPCDGGQ